MRDGHMILVNEPPVDLATVAAVATVLFVVWVRGRMQ